ncbi:hypothetical protein RFI_08961 [Reticulomyxa filosa]|uniref:Uncharacterized protein n=1 Tax=Reticulomyxa filosa TaxID=46433 RepID=X6NQH8_RETFI|nr:hypothetical protein RFI_08961 [Reticulomyxa filosa]|eukprot:ETO28173.1 hypothetical protein RFI_08961 [Reticulomyxa filosa]
MQHCLDVVKGMQEMDLEDALASYKKTEVAITMDYLQKHRVVNNSYGKIKKFLKDVDLLRAWILDDLIHHFHSPIIAIAIVLNAVTLETALAAINCPELDTQLIHESEEKLKLNDTLLRVAACRCFLNAMDQAIPMPSNSVVMPYSMPVVDTITTLKQSQENLK